MSSTDEKYLIDYGGCVDWNIGALFCHHRPLIKLMQICENLEINPRIKYIFGGLPCAMHGGRIVSNTVSIEDAISDLVYFSDMNLGCRLTFSNANITLAEAENDSIGNALLKCLNENTCKNRHGVIVASDILAKYIREKYPNLEIISSVVRAAADVGYGKNKDTYEYYNKFIDSSLYDVVVVNAGRVWDGDDFLDHIHSPKKVEFIAIHSCTRDCPRAKKHYEINKKITDALFYNAPRNALFSELHSLKTWCANVKKEHPELYSSLSYSQIRMLTGKGFKHFKIAGRSIDDGQFLSFIINKIFKPEIGWHIWNTIF